MAHAGGPWPASRAECRAPRGLRAVVKFVSAGELGSRCTAPQRGADFGMHRRHEASSGPIGTPAADEWPIRDTRTRAGAPKTKKPRTVAGPGLPSLPEVR